MSETSDILPDLQACLLCEDVRTEASGQQSLIGVIGAIPAPHLPIGFMKLCLWTRWCGGTGTFLQESSILSADDETPLATSEVRFTLQNLNTHATNVHVFGGLQFQKFGIYHIEVRLEGQVSLRFPLPVVQIRQNQS
ncbi:MAG: DUF6941 family protein [Chthoniobacterales bacterium]